MIRIRQVPAINLIVYLGLVSGLNNALPQAIQDPISANLALLGRPLPVAAPPSAIRSYHPATLDDKHRSSMRKDVIISLLNRLAEFGLLPTRQFLNEESDGELIAANQRPFGIQIRANPPAVVTDHGDMDLDEKERRLGTDIGSPIRFGKRQYP